MTILFFLKPHYQPVGGPRLASKKKESKKEEIREEESAPMQMESADVSGMAERLLETQRESQRAALEEIRALTFTLDEEIKALEDYAAALEKRKRAKSLAMAVEARRILAEIAEKKRQKDKFEVEAGMFLKMLMEDRI